MRTLLLGLLICGCRQGPDPTTGTTREEKFHSALENDDYILRFRLPPGYDGTRAWPLVVQLDPTYVGLEELAITSGLISQHAKSGAWQDAIVVGIDYPDYYTRERDYRLPEPPRENYDGDKADRFHRVLEEEILPHVEGMLKVDKRVLVGHSNGGVFGWYAAFHPHRLFSGIVAADCGQDEALFTYERWNHDRSDSLPIQLYASRAVYNGAAQEITFRELVRRVSSYRDLVFAHDELETDHGGAIYPSFERGLGLILGGEK